jgi:hypothetical protein
VVGVPDGANADDTGAGDQDPGTPADQVAVEVTREGVLGWWRSLFGLDPTEQYQAGGGGQGGQFMFASIEELNGVITKWETERDGIKADRDAIAEAYYSIGAPAGDSMSKGLATASQDSIANMWQHSNAMLNYADNYIAKLKASRQQMSVEEEGAHDRFRNIQA